MLGRSMQTTQKALRPQGVELPPLRFHHSIVGSTGKLIKDFAHIGCMEQIKGHPTRDVLLKKLFCANFSSCFPTENSIKFPLEKQKLL